MCVSFLSIYIVWFYILCVSSPHSFSFPSSLLFFFLLVTLRFLGFLPYTCIPSIYFTVSDFSLLASFSSVFLIGPK